MNKTKIKLFCFAGWYTDSICRKASYTNICKVSSTETFVAGWGADTSGYSR